MNVSKIGQSLMFNQCIDFKLLEQGIVDGDDSWNFKDVRSPFHRLYYIFEGEVFVKDSQTIHHLHKGKFYFMKRNSKMDYYALNRFKEYYIHFQCPLLIKGDLLEEVNDFEEIPESVISLEKFVAMFEKPSLENYLLGWIQFQKLIIQIMAVGQIKKISHIGKKNEYYQLFNYIQLKNSIKVTVEEMATIQRQSVSHFSKQFKQNFGISPKAYLHSYITEKAKVLLLQTNNTIREVGFQLGFEDSSYFSRFFKQRTGYYPLEYRSKNKMF